MVLIMSFPLLAAHVIAALAFGAAGGPGSVGVGIGAGPVCLAEVAQPGHSYDLGRVYVVNTGSGSESVSLRAETPFNGLKGQHVPAAWVSAGYPRLFGLIGQDSVSLGAGQSAGLPLTLNVPPGAKPGTYAADLVAGTVAAASPGSGGQVVFGAGAETNLEFTVGPGGEPPSCGPDPSVTPDPKVPASAYGSAPAASSSPGRGYAAIALTVAAVLAAAAWRRRARRGGRP